MLSGLLSMCVLSTLSLVMFGDQMGSGSKNAQFEKIYTKVKGFEVQIGYWGFFYGLLAFIMSTVFVYNSVWLLLQMVANIMILVLALPYGFDKLMRHFPDLNPAVLEEGRSLVEKIKAQRKYLSIAGFGVSLMLFFVLFS